MFVTIVDPECINRMRTLVVYCADYVLGHAIMEVIEAHFWKLDKARPRVHARYKKSSDRFTLD